MKQTLSLITALFITVSTPALRAAEEEFLSKTIDIGCVVSDIEASVKFYTEAIGFKKSGSFTVPADFCKEVGLTDSKTLVIQKLVLGEGEGATTLKLMQVKNAGGKKQDNTHIDSTLGFSYLTIMVKSSDEALARLKKAGVKPLAKGPVTLPESLDPSIALTLVRDPDGNIVELLGPKPTK